MVTVTIKYDQERVSSLLAEGHADSKKKNDKYDLVCAAISAVLTGAFSNIEEDKKNKMKLEEGYALIETYKGLTYHDQIVIETLIKQLETIAESNKKYLKIVKI